MLCGHVSLAGVFHHLVNVISIFKCDLIISPSEQFSLFLYMSSVSSYMILCVIEARNLQFFFPHLESLQTLLKSSSKKSLIFTFHSISMGHCPTFHPHHFSNHTIRRDVRASDFYHPFYAYYLFNFHETVQKLPHRA